MAYTLHLVASMIMATAILLVHFLIYPQFQNVPLDAVKQYSQFHAKNISWIVVPAMTLELLSLIFLIYQQGFNGWTALIALLLTLIIFITAYYLVPLHQTLSHAPTESTILDLAYYNKPRTFLWVLKLFIVLAYGWVLFVPNIYYKELIKPLSEQEFPSTNSYQTSVSINLKPNQVDQLMKGFSEIIIECDHTYYMIERTAVWQFPDLIIVKIENGQVNIASKALIGKHDFGKNQSRVNQIVDTIINL